MLTRTLPAQGPGAPLVTRSLGSINLTPQKYWRLITKKNTRKKVGADYVFPDGLTDDEVQLTYVQETITRARLEIYEEIINTGESLGGKESSDWGQLTVTESIVNDGTAIDTGVNIFKSNVTPLGNGKSIKITVAYPNALTLSKVNKSIGQDNLIPEKYRRLVQHTKTISWKDSTFAFPTSLTGNQSQIDLIWETLDRARYEVTEEIIGSISSLVGAETDEQGILTITESIVNDGVSPDSGVLVKSSRVTPLGNGKSVKITVSYSSFPVLYDYDIDEETGQTILTSYQIVNVSAAGTATAASGVVTKYKHIDVWRSLKIVSTYSTPAMYEEQRFGAHNFPTLFDYHGYAWTSECGAFAFGNALRGGFSTMVRMRTEITFGTSRSADIDGLTLIPRTLLLGKGVQLPSDLIVDSGSFTYAGACAGTVTFSASSPSYSTYTGSIQGFEQLITGESVKVGKGGLYRTTKVYVKML